MNTTQATRIETLKVAIAFNCAMLKFAPPGADRKTEARVAADKAELAKLLEVVS